MTKIDGEYCDRIYSMGVHAYEARIPRDKCTFPGSSLAHKLWQRGWDDGDRRASRSHFPSSLTESESRG
jgi:hypothetical protein